MSIFDDMAELYDSYGLLDKPMDLKKLKFRVETLQTEELGELVWALSHQDPEEVVDALVDIIVVAAGTLILLGVNGERAWEQVLKANSAKRRGVKQTRLDSDGFDLIKPRGWEPPDHSDNLGDLREIFS